MCVKYAKVALQNPAKRRSLVIFNHPESLDSDRWMSKPRGWGQQLKDERARKRAESARVVPPDNNEPFKTRRQRAPSNADSLRKSHEQSEANSTSVAQSVLGPMTQEEVNKAVCIHAAPVELLERTPGISEKAAAARSVGAALLRSASGFKSCILFYAPITKVHQFIVPLGVSFDLELEQDLIASWTDNTSNRLSKADRPSSFLIRTL
eukprot:g73508.t1